MKRGLITLTLSFLCCTTCMVSDYQSSQELCADVVCSAVKTQAISVSHGDFTISSDNRIPVTHTGDEYYLDYSVSGEGKNNEINSKPVILNPVMEYHLSSQSGFEKSAGHIGTNPSLLVSEKWESSPIKESLSVPLPCKN